MHLCWSDQDGIARALLTAYPETDRLSLSLESLREMIVSLPGFDDAPRPAKQGILEKILWTWMRFSDPHDNGGG